METAGCVGHPAVSEWPMHARFFLGACFLTGALLLPFAPAEPVLAGMVLAGLIQLAFSRTIDQ